MVDRQPVSRPELGVVAAPEQKHYRQNDERLRPPLPSFSTARRAARDFCGPSLPGSCREYFYTPIAIHSDVEHFHVFRLTVVVVERHRYSGALAEIPE